MNSIRKRLANRPVVKSEGKPGNGSTKPKGTRMQTASLRLEIFEMVVLRIICRIQ
jgi:hypothetical protein